MNSDKIALIQPAWLRQFLWELPSALPDLTERMRMVIRLSRLSFEHDTGGPFAAGVFELESGKLVAIGVNSVVANHCSAAHAEIMALCFAQQKLGSYDLGAAGLPRHQLVINAQPCAMCVGAICWSGVVSVAYAANLEQVERLTGFDEGPVHPAWKEELHERGIEVLEGSLNAEACAELSLFASLDRHVYNPRTGRTDRKSP